MATASRSTSRRWTDAVLAIVLLAVGTLAFPFVLDRVVNEWRLARLASAMNRVPHPPGTRHVLRVRALGVLNGNSNHCDFFVADVRSVEGDRTSVDTVYAGRELPSPLTGEPLELDFFRLDGKNNRALDLPDHCADPERWGIPPDLPRDRLYAVWAFDQDYSPSFDIRCN
jgi:hypothetical protein